MKILHVARIGLSLVANAPLNAEVDAKTDAAVGIARAFSFISSDKDTRQAFDWLIKVSDAMGTFHVYELLRCSLFFTKSCSGFIGLQFHTSPKSKTFLS